MEEMDVSDWEDGLLRNINMTTEPQKHLRGGAEERDTCASFQPFKNVLLAAN